ncbi:MAG: DNA primase [Bacilli bacterium]|nr:DNA primase [Bacilli bacterium]
MDNNTINDIRKSIDIIDIISKYLPLTQKGKNYFGVCPFHDDHSPSMSVSKEKQIYKCFSCGATGNVFNFIMDYENVSFKEALKILSDATGIKIDGISVKQNKQTNKELYDIYDISSKLYINNLNTNYGLSAKEYLHNRDINDELIKEFQIGLSLNEKDLLTKVLVKKGFSSKDMIDSGLILKNDYGYSDMYVGRIMFPLYDVSGRIVGYSGRIYNKEDTSKYINTRETKIFKKGEILYNYHRAKESCRKKNQVIITEGFMDVIRCHSVGITNVVAAMGTAITKEHIILIRKLARDIILCFDGDKAGAKATESCINMLLENKITPKIVRLEENLDPDEYIRKYGKEKFIAKLENPINIMDFKLSYLKSNKDMTSTIDTANYVNSVITELNKIDDDILREITIKKVSEESKIDIELLRSKLEKKEIKQIIEPKKNIIGITKYEKAQMYLLYYMLISEDVVKMYDEHVTYMPNDEYRRLAYYIDCFYKENGYIELADIMTYLSNFKNMIDTVSKITNLNLKDEFTKNEIYDYIYTIRDLSIKNEIKKLRDIQKKEVELKKKNEIMEKIIELKKMEQERYYD